MNDMADTPPGPRVAFVTGITGQTGSYLAELLLANDYEVHGLVRRTSRHSMGHIKHLEHHPAVRLHYGDVTDLSSLLRIMAAIKTRLEATTCEALEVYNLAAQSHVHVSFKSPLYTAETTALGTLNVLEAIRQSGLARVARVVHASTSELFGASPPPQNEATPFHPRSPYAVSKLFAYWTVRNYREAYGMFACNSVAFNHESERRGEHFVTRKITLGVARIAAASAAGQPLVPVKLGNLDAGRDWAHASDVVDAMWRMAQADVADDYVVATGELHTVREFAQAAFAHAGMQIEWRGSGEREHAVRVDTGDVVVRVDPEMYRPADVDALRGDSAKLRRATGWTPRVTFDDLVKRMVAHDVNINTNVSQSCQSCQSCQ